jgi:hypothetical protein
MSTIKSENSDLTINASGSTSDIKLQRNGTQVLATTSTGIDVTGSVNSTGEMRITNPSADSQLYLYGASGRKSNIILNEYGVRAWHVGAGTFSSGHLSISDGSTEKLRIQSGGGISFNGDTATANALEDYEEGLWTPAYTTTGGSFTYDNATEGWYTKIGDTVYLHFRIYTTSATVGTGDVTITGLPFTSLSGIHSTGSIGDCRLFAGDTPDTLIGGGGQTLIKPYYRTAVNGQNYVLKTSDLSTGVTNNLIDGQFTYKV